MSSAINSQSIKIKQDVEDVKQWPSRRHLYHIVNNVVMKGASPDETIEQAYERITGVHVENIFDLFQAVFEGHNIDIGVTEDGLIIVLETDGRSWRSQSISVGLSFDEYQMIAQSTAIYPQRNTVYGKMYCALGLVGEAGEYAEKIKKLYRDVYGDTVTRSSMDVFDEDEKMRDARTQRLKELGDPLWYIANAGMEERAQMGQIAADNLTKLFDRRRRGTQRGEGDNR